MERNLENQDWKDKHFTNPFIKECITEFIEKHTELYGDIIPKEALFKRLKDNLDKITFAGSTKALNGKLGEYIGRISDNTDVNEIFLYFNKSDLELSELDKKMWNFYTKLDKQKLLHDIQQRKSEIKSTLFHELTHVAYTIKGKYGIGEKHIFSETGKDYLSGEYRQIGGNNNNIESIINYISSRLEGKKPDEIKTYQAETKAIYMLAEKVNEKSIIQSAWNSDEQQFKHSYIESITKDIEIGEKSYNGFQEGMKKLVIIRQQNMDITENNKKNNEILSQIQQVLDGKDCDIKLNKFEDIKHPIIPKDNIPTSVPKKENNLSFRQKIAKFLKGHELLMNIPFVTSFVQKQLNILSPAVTEQDKNNSSSFSNQRDKLVNRLSNNGEYRKLKPLQANEEQQISEEIDNQLIEENENY